MACKESGFPIRGSFAPDLVEAQTITGLEVFPSGGNFN